MFKPIDYEKHFVIGTPLVPWKVQRKEHDQWLFQVQEIKDMFPNVQFFAALELDHRPIQESYGDFLNRLKDIGATYWTYSLNDGEEDVGFMNRWIRIEMGRNLIREFAQRQTTIDAVLYVDSDIELTSKIVEKLLEVDHHIVSVDVPAYGLSGPVVNNNPRIEEHWNTAGVLLVNAPQYYDLPWYHNLNMGLSDDPTFQYLACRLYERQTFVRKDIRASHKGFLVPVEQRGLEKRKYNES